MDVVSAIRTAGEHNVLIGVQPQLVSRAPTLETRRRGRHPARPHEGELACWFHSTRKKTRSSSRVSLALEGANVKAFSDFESAISWIIMREQSLRCESRCELRGVPSRRWHHRGALDAGRCINLTLIETLVSQQLRDNRIELLRFSRRRRRASA